MNTIQPQLNLELFILIVALQIFNYLNDTKFSTVIILTGLILPPILSH